MDRATGLTTVLGSYILSGLDNREVQYCCPFCVIHGKSPDRKFHLSINRQSGMWICYRCGDAGHVERIYNYFHIKEEVAVSLDMWETTMAKFFNNTPDEPERKRVSYVPLPHGFNFVYKGHPSYDYLRGRGLTEEDIAFYGFGVSIEYPKSVIICDFDDHGDVIFWQARYYGSDPTVSKYRNPFGVDKRSLIYNYYRCVKAEEITVCEGVFSAISAGRTAVALYGKKTSAAQLQMLKALPASTFYLCLDPDASKEAYRLGMDLLETKEVFYIPVPKGKDPNDMSREEFNECKGQSERFDPLSGIRMRLRYV